MFEQVRKKLLFVKLVMTSQTVATDPAATIEELSCGKLLSLSLNTNNSSELKDIKCFTRRVEMGWGRGGYLKYRIIIARWLLFN
jgi:hypothetical protein